MCARWVFCFDLSRLVLAFHGVGYRTHGKLIPRQYKNPVDVTMAEFSVATLVVRKANVSAATIDTRMAKLSVATIIDVRMAKLSVATT